MSSEKKSSAFVAGIGYTIGNILIKGVGILTLPLFSRIMTTAEFGVYNVFMSYDALLFVVIGLAMHSSIRSANLQFRGKIDDYVSSVSLIYLLNFLAFLAAGLLLGDVLSDWLGLEKSLIFILIVYSFSSAVLMLYNTWISLNYAYKQYLIVALINTIGNVLLSLVLIFTAFRDQRDVGRIVGSTLVITILAIFLLVSIFCKARPRVNLRYWKFALKYSLPIVPHGISQVLLAQFDRIMIQRMVSDSAAGIYSLAGNIKIILTVITSSISTAWSTWVFGELDKENRTGIQQRSVQLSALFTILTVGLMALSPELIFILGGEEYEMAKYIAVPMVIDGFILFLYDVVASGEYYARKTSYIMYGTVASAVLSVALNCVCIPRYGYVSAAYTTLIAYVCYLLFHLIICRKLLSFSIIPIKWIIVFCGIVAAAAFVDLLFIDNLLVRWGVCALIVIPMALLLIRNYGGDNIMALLKKKR